MATQVENGFSFHTVKPLIGAVVQCDRQALLDGTFAQEIRGMLEDRGVIVFPQVNFTDEEQIAFSKTLGRFVPEMHGDIFRISMDKKINPQADYVKGAFYWHIDGTMQQVPLFASMLTARKLAPTGGNTESCNTYAAWDALPDEDKPELEGLRVVHSLVNWQLYSSPSPALPNLRAGRAWGQTNFRWSGTILPAARVSLSDRLQNTSWAWIRLKAGDC